MSIAMIEILDKYSYVSFSLHTHDGFFEMLIPKWLTDPLNHMRGMIVIIFTTRSLKIRYMKKETRKRFGECQVTCPQLAYEQYPLTSVHEHLLGRIIFTLLLDCPIHHFWLVSFHYIHLDAPLCLLDEGHHLLLYFWSDEVSSVQSLWSCDSFIGCDCVNQSDNMTSKGGR